MTKQKELGRIWFRGNPWPNGHAVTAFEWTARVERATGIWFDLHLATASYYAEDPPQNEGSDDDEDDDEDLSEWESKILWNNYHSCTLSSTFWGGGTFGFLAGSKHDRLDMSKIGNKNFAFDDNPEDLRPPRPFGIYLTGHDAVSAHRITFKREPKKKTYRVEWSGKIALAYSGSSKFQYEFEAKIAGIPFGGIQFPPGISNQQAMSLADPFLADPYKNWKPQKTKTGVRLIPK